jgi:transposase
MPRARKYQVELLARGTRLVFEWGRPIAQVAADLGIPSETLRKYVRKVGANEGLRPDLPTSEERGANISTAASANTSTASRQGGRR